MNSKTTTTVFGIVALAAMALLFVSGQLVENQAFAYGNHHKHHHSYHYHNNHHKHHHSHHYHKYNHKHN